MSHNYKTLKRNEFCIKRQIYRYFQIFPNVHIRNITVNIGHIPGQTLIIQKKVENKIALAHEKT